MSNPEREAADAKAKAAADAQTKAAPEPVAKAERQPLPDIAFEPVKGTFRDPVTGVETEVAVEVLGSANYGGGPVYGANVPTGVAQFEKIRAAVGKSEAEVQAEAKADAAKAEKRANA